MQRELPTKLCPSNGVRAQASMLQPTRQPLQGAETASSAFPVSPLKSKGGKGGEGWADAEADMLSAEASSAICVQRFDGSRNSAIHTTYRISLRSSSVREPRYPLLRVVFGCERHRTSRQRTLSSGRFDWECVERSANWGGPL